MTSVSHGMPTSTQRSGLSAKKISNSVPRAAAIMLTCCSLRACLSRTDCRAAGVALAQRFEEADAGCDGDVEALDRAL